MIDKVERCGKVPIFLNNKIISSSIITFEDIKAEFVALYEYSFSNAKNFVLNLLKCKMKLKKTLIHYFIQKTVNGEIGI